MKTFAERNPTGRSGAIGVVVVAALVIGALQYKKLPLLNRGRDTTPLTSPRPVA